MTKNCWPPKLVDGIFEVFWHLRKFWWVKQIICIENGFALTDFFAKQTILCSVNWPLLQVFFSLQRWPVNEDCEACTTLVCVVREEVA